MSYITFKCSFCTKNVTSNNFLDVSTKERLHTLSCGHSYVETLIEKKAHLAESLKSSDNRTLYPFQIKGVEFAETSNVNCLIADEMGLGKTIQALALLKLHGELLPCMIICKSALKYQWSREICRWFDDDVIPDVIDKATDMILPRAQFYIFSFDILRRFNGKLEEFIAKRGIQTVIIDECQQIKSTVAQRTIELRKLVKDIPHKIALSGTPIKNNAAEYFTILNILKPELFRHFTYFCNQWVEAYWDGYRYKYGGLANPKRFMESTKDFIIRREREEVMPELPSCNRTFHYYDMAESVQSAYDKIGKELFEYMEYKSEGDSAFEKASNIMAYIARMRHLVGLSKIDNCIDFVAEFLGSCDRKLVIFAHHKDVQEIIHNKISQLCKEINLDVPLLLNAELPNEKRFELVENFQEGKNRILIASQLASGEGLNLQKCADCIMLERQWNPANEEQCEARFIRIGQKSSQVNARYIVALGTVDEYLTEIVERKRDIFAQTMKGESPVWDENAIMGEMKQKLLKMGREKWSL